VTFATREWVEVKVGVEVEVEVWELPNEVEM
jgi:hypothetical protein